MAGLFPSASVYRDTDLPEFGVLGFTIRPGWQNAKWEFA